MSLFDLGTGRSLPTVEYAGGDKWVEFTDQSDDLVVHKWSCTGLSIHKIDQFSGVSAVKLPWSSTEVVKVADSTPASGRSRRAPSAVVARAVGIVVDKAGQASAPGPCGGRVVDHTWTVTDQAGGETPGCDEVELALTQRAQGAVAA